MAPAFANSVHPHAVIRRTTVLSCLILLALYSCKPIPKIPPPELSAESAELSPKDTRLDIFIDFTESMRGFVAAGQKTPYDDLLETVESVATAEFSNEAPRLFKFGNKAMPLTNRAERFLPQAYGARGDNDLRDTRLDVILKDADPQRLQIVVTDLFQSDNDINQVTSVIQQRFLDRGKALGILGWKTQFKGTIFDIGLGSSKQQHNGLRPVYVLALGRPSDVDTFVSALQGQLSRYPRSAGTGEFESTVISPQFTRALPKWRLPTRAAVAKSSPAKKSADLCAAGGPINWFRATGLDDYRGQLQSGNPHALVREYRGGKTPQATVELCTEVTLPRAYAASSMPALQLLPIARRLPPNKTELVPDSQAADTIRPKRLRAQWIDREKRIALLDMAVDINVGNLKKASLYRFDLAAVVPRDSASLPSWVDAWSILETQRFDGERTINLTRFVHNVWNASMVRRPPVFAEGSVYLYVD